MTSSKSIISIITGLFLIVIVTAVFYFEKNSSNQQDKSSSTPDAGILQTENTQAVAGSNSQTSQNPTQESASTETREHNLSNEKPATPDETTATDGDVSEDSSDLTADSGSQPKEGPTDIKQEESDSISNEFTITGSSDELLISLPDYTENKALAGELEHTRFQIQAPDGSLVTDQLTTGSEINITKQELPDGLYHWSAVSKPVIDASAMEKLKAARISGNFNEEQRLVSEYREKGQFPSEEEINNNVKYGTFRIFEGSVIDKVVDE